MSQWAKALFHGAWQSELQGQDTQEGYKLPSDAHMPAVAHAYPHTN